MTTKELDIKLAKDIARIRIMAAPKNKLTTLTMETVRAMNELDKDDGEQLITSEFETYLNTEEQLNQINEFITTQYLKAIISKLKIRSAAKKSSKKLPSRFSSEDRALIKRQEVEEIEKAVAAVKEAMAAGETKVIINITAAEACGFHLGCLAYALSKRLIEELNLTPLAPLAPALNLEMKTFMEMDSRPPEYLEKVCYYGKWIYERSQPLGIIIAEVNLNA